MLRDPEFKWWRRELSFPCAHTQLFLWPTSAAAAEPPHTVLGQHTGGPGPVWGGASELSQEGSQTTAAQRRSPNLFLSSKICSYWSLEGESPQLSHLPSLSFFILLLLLLFTLTPVVFRNKLLSYQLIPLFWPSWCSTWRIYSPGPPAAGPAGDKCLPAVKDSAESGRTRCCVDSSINLLNESKLMQHLLFGRCFHTSQEAEPLDRVNRWNYSWRVTQISMSAKTFNAFDSSTITVKSVSYVT